MLVLTSGPSLSPPQKIPPNFVSATELDVPGHMMKDRYKTILPSQCHAHHSLLSRHRRPCFLPLVYPLLCVCFVLSRCGDQGDLKEPGGRAGTGPLHQRQLHQGQSPASFFVLSHFNEQLFKYSRTAAVFGGTDGE